MYRDKVETSRRDPVRTPSSNEVRPAKASHQPEASLAWS